MEPEIDLLAARKANREKLNGRPSRGLGWRGALVLALLTFAGGAGLVGYMGMERGWFASDEIAASPRMNSATGQLSAANRVATGAASGQSPTMDGAMIARLDEMEQRFARLNLQTEAAAGNAARAEGLLIAFAARRAIERGSALGYLEGQLRLRFGEAQPNAVDTIIDFAANPVLLDGLEQQLATLETPLKDPDEKVSFWDRVTGEVGSLFVIRRADAPSPLADRRFERSQRYLENGRVQAAINEISQMPGRTRANVWLANAGRYVAAEKALDLVETAALLEPRKLGDETGTPVVQPPVLPAPPAPASMGPNSSAAPSAPPAALPTPETVNPPRKPAILPAQ